MQTKILTCLKLSTGHPRTTGRLRKHT